MISLNKPAMDLLLLNTFLTPLQFFGGGGFLIKTRACYGVDVLREATDTKIRMKQHIMQWLFLFDSHVASFHVL